MSHGNFFKGYVQDVEEENNYPFQSMIRIDFCEDTFILIPDR